MKLQTVLISFLLAPHGISAQGGNPGGGGGGGNNPGGGKPTDPPSSSPSLTPTKSPSRAPTQSPSRSPTESPSIPITSCEVIDSIDWLYDSGISCTRECCISDDSGGYTWPYTKEVTSTLRVRNVGSLVKLSFPLLERVSAPFGLFLSANNNLQQLSVPRLAYASSINIRSSPSLGVLDFPSLLEVKSLDGRDANFKVQINDALTSMIVPKLSLIFAEGASDWGYGGNANLQVTDCPILGELQFGTCVCDCVVFRILCLMDQREGYLT